ncbi:hypothetical protein BHYA_0076g00220 [Botrytis hyacinthi]|uniref:Uncharacterized protein n=1 Tax=Botrytis hyacinthi TaxID=278943 RepID=A0A4Z1GTY0_9HELO|nr:hypothetical protein BHYA_0076g00220 [Botrytis hyacinthi]
MTSQSDSKQPPHPHSPASMTVPQIPSPIHTEQPVRPHPSSPDIWVSLTLSFLETNQRDDSITRTRISSKLKRRWTSLSTSSFSYRKRFARIVLRLWVVYAVVNVVNAVAAYDRKDERDSKVIRISG